MGKMLINISGNLRIVYIFALSLLRTRLNKNKEMNFKTSNEQIPGFCLEGANIDNMKAYSRVNDLTVEELKCLVGYWVHSVITAMLKPEELVPIFHSRKESAKLLNISLPIMDELIRSRQIPVKMIGRHPVILAEDLNGYIKTNVFKAELKEEPEPEVIEF